MSVADIAGDWRLELGGDDLWGINGVIIETDGVIIGKGGQERSFGLHLVPSADTSDWPFGDVYLKGHLAASGQFTAHRQFGSLGFKLVGAMDAGPNSVESGAGRLTVRGPAAEAPIPVPEKVYPLVDRELILLADDG